jgi:hypothetical protein
MRLIHFNPYYINPDKVIYIQRLANITRLFLEGGFTIDMPESDKTVVYRLAQEGVWENRKQN